MGNNNYGKKFANTSLLMGLGIGLFTLGSIYFTIKETGFGDLINQIFGSSFWFIVIGFVVFIILIIYILQRWLLGGLKPKDIPNGLPATATVIKSYQAGMSMRAGANQFYSIIIEANITNPQGETWFEKIEQMLPITQVGIFQPGVSFAVKYDPNDRSKVVFDQSAQTSGSQQKPFGSVNVPGYGTVDSIMANQAKQHQPQDIVLQLQATSALLNELNANGNGVTAEAEVLSKTQLIDNFMNGADAYKLRIRVNATDISSFETDVVLLIQKPSVYKIEPGKTVYVKYDRNNPQRTVISGTDKPDSAVAL
ncbi:MAG: hypothetical protein WCY16_06975 [Weeksellaceae bacterium]